MKTSDVTGTDLHGVFAVPPLCRREDSGLDWGENEKVVAHLKAGGVHRLMYGGNAFLYHLPLAEYEELLEWLGGLDDELWCIPSVGPSFGRMMDQVPLLKKHRFPCVMALPCADPRDAAGLELGLRRFAASAETPLIVYLKEEQNFGSDLMAGLDAVARLVQDGICVGIKYAVVRAHASQDAYLDALLARVDRKFVISGMGERPAIVHLEQFRLQGFTSGSVCLAPAKTQEIFECCERGDFAGAAVIRDLFLPVEDLRDAWGPARVLHAATGLAGIAKTGPILPFVSGLGADQLAKLEPVAKALAGS